MAAKYSTKVDYYENSGSFELPEAVLAKLATRSSLTPDSAKLILVMVGLPARGKSFICHKLQAFLSWSGHRTEVFNAGQKRRNSSCEMQEAQSRMSADFFDSGNAQAKQTRETIAMATLDELLAWLEHGGEVAIFDATNSNRARRRHVLARADEAAAAFGQSVSVVFIESLCDEPALLEANMRNKVRASPDFKHLDEATALADLQRRIANYEAAYEPVSDDEGAYIKLYNLSSKVTAHQVFGRMSKSVLPFVMSMHVHARPVYLAAFLTGTGNADEHGKRFAEKISAWLKRRSATHSLRLLSSTQPASISAAAMLSSDIGAPVTHQSGLNPLDRGTTVAEGDQLLAKMRFDERFAGGESFQDLVRRLESSLLEIEASMEPVLVLAHGSPCRALRAYFLSLEIEKCMGAASSEGAIALANESESVVELVPKVGGGFVETIHHLT
ncbi:hypothetical protein AB1Y20_020266 [Prymnesium parvum]|uniref:6-phosphofructo-2-kinase domain-containing protein n=1 Tax=Prymnesium parvum TaxID=97485 RepID=A0AB34JX43_PRYPA